jgi:hypothetical protein
MIRSGLARFVESENAFGVPWSGGRLDVWQGVQPHTEFLPLSHSWLELQPKQTSSFECGASAGAWF